MDGDKVILPEYIETAVELLKKTGGCEVLNVRSKDDGWYVETSFKQNLPSRCTGGITSDGVYEVEPVSFYFGEEYPIRLPSIHLRKDFNPNLPHLYPINNKDDFPRPCLSDRYTGDFVHGQRSFQSLIIQLKDWLARAASQGLYDEQSGYEPILPNYNHGEILCYSNQIARYAASQQKRGHRFCAYRYLQSNGIDFIYGSISLIDPEFEKFSINDSKVDVINSIAVFVWPEINKILFERDLFSVKKLIDLLKIITRVSIRSETLKSVKEAKDKLLIHTKSYKKYSILLLIAIRRPALITDNDHNVELLAFNLDLNMDPKSKVEDCEIRQLAISQSTSLHLNARLSNINDEIVTKNVGFLGCGCLGSKISVHLAKAGVGHMTLVDKEYLSAHNLARHAINDIENKLFLNRFYKTHYMESILKSHNVTVHTNKKNLLEIVTNQTGWETINSNTIDLYIDSTASDNIFEAINSYDWDHIGRLVTVSYHAEGKAASLILGGSGQQPRQDDVMASLYDEGIDNPDICHYLYDSNKGLSKVFVGVGCHSMTMKMSDIDASKYASSLAKIILKYLDEGFPKKGQWWFGFDDDTAIGTNWLNKNIDQVVAFRPVTSKNKTWEVRVLGTVVEKISNTSKEKLPDEWGGPVYGIVNTLLQRITVTRTEPAPSDSKSSPGLFEMGTLGLKERVESIEKMTNENIVFLGTWHSHTIDVPASDLDKETLNKYLSQHKNGPMLMLICMPNGSLDILLDEVSLDL